MTTLMARALSRATLATPFTVRTGEWFVGGDSHVPLAFLSLTENLMMIAMAAWRLAMKAVGGRATGTMSAGM